MSKLVRKNLVLEAEKLRELARRRGKSESAVVRELVDEALGWQEMADEMMAAVRELNESGGIDDVFGRLPIDEPAREGERGSPAAGS